MNAKKEKELQAYLVGGAVRDKLLGRPISEKDYVVVGATPQELIDLGFRLVGKDFPVFLHPETQDEYALARTERKTGPGYKGFTVHASPNITLEEDLQRRDFTINAMAEASDGQIIDPFGGQQDLKNKIIRHVSKAFIEDPVRILRAARFMARYKNLGFKIVPETKELMQEMVVLGEVDELVPERVWQEFFRALGEPDPQEFIIGLRECGALKILFPEIDVLFGVPNPAQWHPEIDTGIHTLMVLEQAAKLTSDKTTRFAALMHDLGKGMTPPEQWPHHPGHDERGVPIIKRLCQQYLIPKEFQDLAVLMSRYHTVIHRVFDLKPSTIVKTLEKLDAFRRPQRFKQVLLACEADFKGRTGNEAKNYPQKDFFWLAYEAASKVDVQNLISQGYTDQVLGDKLHEARVMAVKALDRD